jgi:hypothetical protein
LSTARIRRVQGGITNIGTNRLTAFQLRGWQVLTLELFETGSDAQAVERVVKRWWRTDMGLPAFLGPEDMPRTGGWSETIAADAVSAFKCIDRIRIEARAAREVGRLHPNLSAPFITELTPGVAALAQEAGSAGALAGSSSTFAADLS